MKEVSFKTFFSVYGFAAVLAVALQSYLKLVGIDPNSGFYYSSHSVVVLLLQILLISSILFWFAATFFRKARHDYALNYRHPATGVFSVLTGVSIIAYTLSDVTSQVLHTQMGPFRQKLSVLFAFLLGLLAGVSMIVGGARPNYGRYGKPGAFLGVIPCLWQFVMLLSRFNYFAAVTTVSDTLINILFMCFSTIFLLGQARIIYGLGIRNGRSYAFPSGMAASVLGLALVIPNLVYTLADGQPMPSYNLTLPESIYILTLSIYAPVFLTGFAKSIRKV